MTNIILCCQHGASTALLAGFIKTAAANKGIDVAVNAYGYDQLNEEIYAADIVLIGPQIRYLADELRQTYKDAKVPIMVIDSVDYGMMDGDAIITKTMDLIKKQ